MKVFKFGGASVKDASGVKNLLSVLEKVGYKDTLVVVSAMAKTTNALENIIEVYFDNKQSINQQGIDINVGMAQDESLRAKDANRQASQAMAGAQEGLATGLQGAAGMIPGYLQGRGDKLTSDIINQVGSMDVFKEVGLPQGFDATNEVTRKMFTDNPLFNKLSNLEKKEMLLNLKGGKSSVIQDLASMLFDK